MPLAHRRLAQPSQLDTTCVVDPFANCAPAARPDATVYGGQSRATGAAPACPNKSLTPPLGFEEWGGPPKRAGTVDTTRNAC